MTAVGRWRLFRKAGRPAWHSLIPLFNIYKEYDLCWKGTAGILFLLLMLGIPMSIRFLPHNDALVLLVAALALIGFVISVLEALKLSKACGKGALTGICLLLVPHLSRFILGLCGAQYQGQESRGD